MKRVTSAGPSITNAEIELVTEAVRDGWQDKMNFHIDCFAKEFAEYIGVKYCLPTAHCTDAIHLSILALDIGPGDEVIVPDLTWVASVSPICYVGATPVFADVDETSWCISAETIERCITPKTKAVVVVDLLGNMPDWDEIKELCQRYGLTIIEDAAEGLGATYKGGRAGNFGDVSLFSFNATKLIMAGQGGAFCTNDESLYKRAKLYSHHGIDRANTGRYYWSNVVGYNYNWTNIQAALALAQLRRIGDLLSHKRWMFDQYLKGLESVEGLLISPKKKEVEHTYWITTVVIDQDYDLEKEDLIVYFGEKLIDLRPLFYPVSSMPPFRRYVPHDSMGKVNRVAYGVSKFGVCLPSGNNIVEQDIGKVCKAFVELLGNQPRRTTL